jgi:hypothetical protein
MIHYSPELVLAAADMEGTSVWSSLEIAKLIVSGLVPLTVALLGIWVGRLAKRLEDVQWRNQKLIEKRILIVDKIAPDLNDLFCYYAWVGRWKEQSPADVIERKRRLDHTVHINRPFLTTTCMEAYSTFMDQLFVTYAAPGQDARLRTTLTSNYGDRVKDYCGRWEPSWNARFTGGFASRADLDALYHNLMNQLADQLGVERNGR